MRKFDGCLLASDIDGTLISGELLPKRNIERIEYFVSEGGAFSLSTGRTAAALGMITEKLKHISPSVLSNGCVIYDLKAKKAISQKYLSSFSLQMADRISCETDIGIELHSADRVFVLKRSAASDLHEQYEDMNAEFLTFDEIKQQKINKIIYFKEKQSHDEILELAAKEYQDECTFYSTCAFIGGVKQNYFEQLPKDVSKASALIELCKILNIRKGGFFAIGDYYNDLEMIKRADIGAVPEESPDDIKEYAAAVVGKAKDGAVADFIDYLEENYKDGQ